MEQKEQITSRWVQSPQPEWKEPLAQLAREYPFDQKRRELLELDPIKHLNNSWQNPVPGTQYLVNLIKNQPVGWLKLAPNRLHSDNQNREVYNTSWELIEQNRNDIRLAQMQALRAVFPGTIIHLRQPTKNRNATALLKSHPNIFPGGCDQFLGRWQNLSVQSANRNIDREMSLENGDQISPRKLKNLLEHYRCGQLHTDSPYSPEAVRKIYFQWTKKQLKDKNHRARGLINKGELIGLVIVRFLPPSFPARRKAGSIAFLQVAPAVQGNGYGKYLLKIGERLLLDKEVEYIELKVNQANEPAKQFYRNQGYKLITRRSHFYFQAPEKTP